MQPTNPADSGKVRIYDESQIVNVRKSVRSICRKLGFSDTEVTRIVTAASELARNVDRYAGQGEMHWRVLDMGGADCLELVFEDEGPGISDVAQAMTPGFSTSRSLGLGLPGAKRLMDEMEIQTEAGKGTSVTVRKWCGRKTMNNHAAFRGFNITEALRA